MKQQIAIKRMECFGKDCVIMELSESDREKCKALVDEIARLKGLENAE